MPADEDPPVRYPTAHPRTRISRANAFRSLFEGRDGYRAGRPVTTCPFDLSGDSGEQFNGMWWLRGWRMARAAAEGADAPTKGPPTPLRGGRVGAVGAAPIFSATQETARPGA